MALTKKQKEVYDYLLAYHDHHGHPPTQNEIKDHFGLKSLGSVQKYLQYLNKEGLLESHWNQRRGVEVKAPQQLVSESDSEAIALLGLVAAGNPIEAIENPTNTIVVPRHFLKGGFRYFALTVKGDSMVDAGILEGDVIVCRSTKEARNGQIVVAVIDGEATVKTFSQQNKKRLELLPSNKKYSPIIVDESVADFKIVGTLVGLSLLRMKKIIHVDMDCFYAQVEMRDNPALKNVPLAIGGLPGTRSVLCTSNYIARKFGVKSAMPTDYAIKLCPALVVLPPCFKKYSDASEIINAVFHQFSNAVEAVSLDEAYLDVSDAPSATAIATEIKKEIFKRTGLTASVGVAPNKFLAKIASDWKKPDGLFVISPLSVESFVKCLPVKLIPGVGKKGHETLESLGIQTCEDLRSIPQEILSQFFGKFSFELKRFAYGIDEREVESEWERKSLSVETTFSKDISEENLLQLELLELYEEMFARLQTHFEEEGEKKLKKIFVKVKFNDFSKTTCEETLRSLPDTTIDSLLSPERFASLLSHCLQKKENPVRLIGIGVRFVTQEEYSPVQLSLLPYCG